MRSDGLSGFVAAKCTANSVLRQMEHLHHQPRILRQHQRQDGRHDCRLSVPHDQLMAQGLRYRFALERVNELHDKPHLWEGSRGGGGFKG